MTDALELILDEILNDMNNINKYISNDCSIDDINNSYIKLKNYDNELKKINKTMNTILSIQNNIKVIFKNIILKKSNRIQKNNNLIDNNELLKYLNITNINNYDNIDYFKMPVIEISNTNIDNMINCPLYHLKETNQYAIKINNNIIKGNIGNITTNKEKKIKIYKCCKENCKGKFFNNECIYRHKGDIRNFTSYSWNSITKYSNKLDKDNTRFVGSLSSLTSDLPKTNKKEKKLRNKQLMHDILLYMVLDKYL